MAALFAQEEVFNTRTCKPIASDTHFQYSRIFFFFFLINDFLRNLAGWLEFTTPRFAFLYPPVLF